MIKRISDLRLSIEKLRETGIQRGDDTGFKCFDELYSVKKGTFTIILGAPTHGKSEIIFEILLNQAEKFGKKSIILSPETGNAEEITMELIHKHLRKSAYKTNMHSCDDKDFYAALNWVDHHFVIADDDEKSYSFDDLSKQILKFEKDNDVKFDIVMAEPWNELDHKLSLAENSGRQDLSIEDELSYLRRFCKKEEKHTFLSFHPSYQELVKGKDGLDSFYAMPKAREAAGGQATLRKAFSWINIWRPPVGMLDKEGIPYAENELLVQIEKSKPKGVGKRGMCNLFFDWKSNRYYEFFDGNKSYAFDHEKLKEKTETAMQPSKSFEIKQTDLLDQTQEEPPF